MDVINHHRLAQCLQDTASQLQMLNFSSNCMTRATFTSGSSLLLK